MTAVDPRELLEFVVRSLVRRPDAVQVRALPGEGTLVLEVRVDPEDAGLIIGRRGRVVRAIRTLVRAAGRDGRRVVVEVV